MFMHWESKRWQRAHGALLLAGVTAVTALLAVDIYRLSGGWWPASVAGLYPAFRIGFAAGEPWSSYVPG